MTAPEPEEFPCPKCGGKVIRPRGVSTHHSCGTDIPATDSLFLVRDVTKL